MMKLLTLLFFLTLPILLCGGETTIIRNGIPTPEAFYDHNTWKSTSQGLTGTGAGNPVYAKHLYSPEEFEVKLTLRLTRFEGGAARISIGEVNCGFDGGKAHEIFIETEKTPARFIEKHLNTIVPGETFQITILGKNGKLEYRLDNRLLTTHAYGLEPLAIAVNPWRSTLSIENFTIRGKQAGLLSSTLPASVYRHLVAIDHDTALIWPESNLPVGKYRLCLAPVDGQAAALEQEIEVDEDGMIQLSASLLSKVYTNIESPHVVRVAELQLQQAETAYRCRLSLYDPSAPPVPAQGEVSYRNGSGSFLINGLPVGTHSGILGSFNERIAEKALTRFGQIGINGVIVLLHPYKFIDATGKLDTERFQAAFTRQMAEITTRNPNAYFKIYFHLDMPPAWCKQHTSELIVLDNGVDTLANTPGRHRQPSYASEMWRRQMGTVLELAIRLFQQSPFADRIPYLRLCYANCGEWNHWGYHEEAYVDYSEPMQKAFAQWLRDKYQTAVALRTAWGSPDIDFNSSNLVPVRANRLAGGDFLRAGGSETRPSVDYYTFFQDYAAQTILHFAKIAKTASQRKMLIGSYYGYYFGHYGLNPYHFQDSGNYGLGRILESPDIDFIGGPYPYGDRRFSMIVNGITGSIRLHRKLWESENDERTHHSGERHRHR